MAQVNNKKKKQQRTKQAKTKKLQKPPTQKAEKTQMTIAGCFGLDISESDPSKGAIEATGDPLTSKPKGILRYAFQNINGISIREGLQVMPEIATIGALDIDVAAFTETNIHWNQTTRDKVQQQLHANIGNSRVVCASNASTRVEDGYHPGGTMTAIVGNQVGRIGKTGSDPWGRFTWTEMIGERNEGILVICAYRVSQTKGAVPGPTTSFSQQINEMIKEGDFSLDPRTRILDDLRTLITSKREEGFRPILMMDANNEWLDSGSKTFQSFVKEMGLVDHLYDKFKNKGLTETTYARGKRRIDFILVDASITHTIKRIGTLGLHDGILSDHVMLYMDIDEKALFKAIMNRPVLHPTREFKIEHADKCEKFINKFREYVVEKKFPARVERLVTAFKRNGATKANIKTYHTLDTEITECILSAAKTVVRCHFGYQRSRKLTDMGQLYHFWKSLLSSKYNKHQLSKKSLELAANHGISHDMFSKLSKKDIRKKVTEQKRELKQVQNNAAEERIDWLEKNAQNIARAAGVVDWEKKMNDMARLTEERNLNRRMTNAIKGNRQSVNTIEIPKFDWFYSKTKCEIYHYERGVFEAYSAYTPQQGLQPTLSTKFYKHHHLKVMHEDAVPAKVTIENDHIHLNSIDSKCKIWKEISKPKEIERLILDRNERHLQQAKIEDGRIHDPIMQKLTEQHGTKDLLESLRKGDITINDATDEAIQAWINAVKQTSNSFKKTQLPKLTGVISPEDYQEAFKVVTEKTTSSPSGLHYSIWKTLAKEDDFAQWQSIMMSLPFMYGFVNNRWAKVVDVMLEKKKGVRQIHQLRIIGIVEGDFNTALKILFARRLMKMAEATGMSDEQWGSRANRTSTDAALRKMMAFEYGRYMKATIAMFANDQTACFDRMWPEISNVVAGSFGCDINVRKCRAKTKEAMVRHCKTGLGVSKKHYTSYRIKGETQGLADVASIWAMKSSQLLTAHSFLYNGIHLPGVNGKTGIKRNNDAYVDDVDTYAASMENKPGTAEDVMTTLTCGAQKWTNIQDVVAASTAFHKCLTQILSWKERKGTLEVDYDFNFKMELLDSKGAKSSIQFAPPNKPNKGLGFHIAMDGNLQHELIERKKKITHTCRAAAGMQLNQKAAFRMHDGRLHAQTAYGMRLSYFTQKECQELDVIVNRTFLPLMKVNRGTPRAVVHGPLQYGGMAIAKHSARQDKWGIDFMIMTLRWDKTTANDIITVLDAFQLISGFATHVLMSPKQIIDYGEIGWISHIRNRLRELNGQLLVEKAWRPDLQRKGDTAIMENIVNIMGKTCGITKKERLLANQYRLWARITCVSDIASIDGKYIEIERMERKWRATPMPNNQWPNLPKPTKAHAAAFRKCIRKTICKTASPYK